MRRAVHVSRGGPGTRQLYYVDQRDARALICAAYPTDLALSAAFHEEIESNSRVRTRKGSILDLMVCPPAVFLEAGRRYKTALEVCSTPLYADGGAV